MKSRRNKPYRPRAKHAPLIVGAQMVFAPVLAIVEQLDRDGTLTTTASGVPIFQAGDGKWYETATALDGVIEHAEMWAARHGRAVPVESLKQFVRFVRFSMNIPATLMEQLRTDLPALQGIIARGNPNDMVDLLRQVQIKVQFEKGLLVQSPNNEVRSSHVG